MVKTLRDWGLRIGFSVLAVSAAGVCVAYVGMLFDLPRVWQVGTYLAIPLIVVCLPICVLFCVFGLVLYPTAFAAHALSLVRKKLSGQRENEDGEKTENG